MWYFLLAFFVSLALTAFVRAVAGRLRIVDRPDGERKLHTKPVPLLGGVAIFVCFWGLVGYFLLFRPTTLGLNLLTNQLAASFVASFIILLVGIADDIKPTPALFRLILTAVAVLFAVTSGLELAKITNPFGGTVFLSSFLGGLFIFCWLMGAMYTIKITDGIDGLSAGIVTIGALMIFAFTSTKLFFQPNVGLIALLFAGSCLGFLVFNFHPASIFLGESGSLFIGFMLGVLAVISGGKVAVALLVMAIPALDLARVLFIRLKFKKSPFAGDRLHLHYELLQRGWSERKVVFVFYGIALLGGAAALFLQSTQKFALLFILFLAMLAVGWKISKRVTS